MKKKLALLGNCQVYALNSYLNSCPSFFSEWEILPIPPVFQISDGVEFLSILKEVDCIAAQPLFSSVGGCDMSLDALKLLNKNTLIYPNVYFDGYNPELFYLKIDGALAKSPLFDYTLANILLSYINGHSINQCFDVWYSFVDDLDMAVDQNHARANVDDSLSELTRREALCDLTVASFIKRIVYKERVFHTVNHPASVLMRELSSQLFYKLQSETVFSPGTDVDLFRHTVIPMIRSVRSIFNFNDVKEFRINNVNHEILTVVAEFYDWFSHYSVDQLTAGLFKQFDEKPLLARLLGVEHKG